MTFRLAFLAAILFFASPAKAEGPIGFGSISPSSPEKEKVEKEKTEKPATQNFDAKIISLPSKPPIQKPADKAEAVPEKPSEPQKDSLLGQINQYSVGEEMEETKPEFVVPPADDVKAPLAEPDSNADNQLPEKEKSAEDSTATPTEKTEEEKAEEQEKHWLPKPRASVQVVDKTKSRSVNVKSEIGKEYSVGSLVYTVKKCFAAAEEYPPDNAALVEIAETQNDKTKKKLFYGWMFSSVPALTFLENQVYDVVISSCSD